MAVTPDTLKAALAELAKDQSRAGQADAKIVEAAHERRDAIQAQLAELEPKAARDMAAGAEYASLIAERGQIDVLLGDSSD